MRTMLVILFLLIVPLELRYEPTYHDGTARVSEVILFEDGSYQVGQLTGCLPFSPCKE